VAEEDERPFVIGSYLARRIHVVNTTTIVKKAAFADASQQAKTELAEPN
jgi:hypothetical protein